jgi:hypothetical protein
MMLEEEYPLCPECGYYLTGTRFYKKDTTGEIIIEFFCDEAGDDWFRFQILTGLTDDDIAKLTKIGKTIERKMGLKLVERKSEEEALREIDLDENDDF